MKDSRTQRIELAEAQVALAKGDKDSALEHFRNAREIRGGNGDAATGLAGAGWGRPRCYLSSGVRIKPNRSAAKRVR